MGLRGRVVSGVGAVAAAVALAGCYGSTEPATDIGYASATLHGYGTTNHGPADVFFRYWPTQYPGSVGATTGRRIPANTTGPYSEPAPNVYLSLEPDTSYTYRLCGQDVGAPGAVCAQTRTFRTGKPSGDWVSGGFFFSGGGHSASGTVDAHSDPGGARPGGTIQLPADGTQYAVTCLRVEGRRAAIGGVSGSRSVLFEVEDGGPTTGFDGDAIRWTTSATGTAPDCAAATLSGIPPTPSGAGSFISLYEAP